MLFPAQAYVVTLMYAEKVEIMQNGRTEFHIQGLRGFIVNPDECFRELTQDDLQEVGFELCCNLHTAFAELAILTGQN